MDFSIRCCINRFGMNHAVHTALSSVFSKKLTGLGFYELPLFSNWHAFKSFIVYAEPVIHVLRLESGCFHMKVVPKLAMIILLFVILNRINSALNVLGQVCIVMSPSNASNLLVLLRLRMDHNGLWSSALISDYRPDDSLISESTRIIILPLYSFWESVLTR